MRLPRVRAPNGGDAHVIRRLIAALPWWLTVLLWVMVYGA